MRFRCAKKSLHFWGPTEHKIFSADSMTGVVTYQCCCSLIRPHSVLTNDFQLIDRACVTKDHAAAMHKGIEMHLVCYRASRSRQDEHDSPVYRVWERRRSRGEGAPPRPAALITVIRIISQCHASSLHGDDHTQRVALIFCLCQYIEDVPC